MKVNRSSALMLQTTVALTLAAILTGCEVKSGVGLRDELPTGPEDGTAAVQPAPNNSGPHQFPLDVHTKKDFYPEKGGHVKVYVRDNKTIIIVPGVRAKTNSGPHQTPGSGN